MTCIMVKLTSEVFSKYSPVSGQSHYLFVMTWQYERDDCTNYCLSRQIACLTVFDHLHFTGDSNGSVFGG